MAEKLCELKKKGGGAKYTETSLWTNSTPDASGGFAAQRVTLSDSIDNYKYIAIDYKFGVGTTDRTRVVYPVDEFKKSLNNSGVNHTCAYFGTQNSANAQFARRVYYVTSTSIGFAISTQLGANASYATQNIPLEILGLNELAQGKRFDESVLWTNSAPTSSFAAQTVTLSDNLSNYDYFKIKFRLSTSNASSAMVMDSVSDFLTNYSNTSSTWRGTIFYTTSTVHMIRRFRNNNSSGSEIRFMATMLCVISDHTWTDSTNLDYLIPTEIIGCKFR